jgi:hypothetical protein
MHRKRTDQLVFITYTGVQLIAKPLSLFSSLKKEAPAPP